MSFDNIRIVLISPTHPGNIGGVARAMKNMALHRLVLVTPAVHTGPEAIARSAGAEDILETARICASLEDALSGCRLVIGTTARQRRLSWPEHEPRNAAQLLVSEARKHQVALVFGAERTGLTNSELEKCHAVATIPSNPDFSSLNLVGAVQILAYELFMARAGENSVAYTPDHGGTDEPLADCDQVAGFYRHLEQTLDAISFFNTQRSRVLMRRLIRLFNRARLEVNEVNILRGILTAVQSSNAQRDIGKPGDKLNNR